MVRAKPLLALLAVGALLAGCGDDKGPEALARQDPSTLDPSVLYSRGVDALNVDYYHVAQTNFNNVQQYYPYSSWATNAQLMEGYSEYLQQKYTDAIGSLDRFIQLHPTNTNIAYAYYLRALCYYEQISDIQRDQKSTADAMNALQDVVNRFPESAYARDASLKIDLCRDHLAGKEMEVARYYQKQHLYAAAIGRYQRVVDDFQTTNHVPEALARLTEIYLALGLPAEARRTASVLAHNYPGNVWYEDTWNQLVADKQVQGKIIGQADNGGFFHRHFGWIF